MYLSSIRFATQTAIGRQQQKKLNQIINNLIDIPQSSQFLHPVAWKQLQLDDYPDIVQNPMNILQVQQNIKNKQYQFIQQALDHLQLIWDNCKLYNSEGYFYDIAEKMEKSYKKMIKNYLPTMTILTNTAQTKQQTVTPIVYETKSQAKKNTIVPVKQIQLSSRNNKAQPRGAQLPLKPQQISKPLPISKPQPSLRRNQPKPKPYNPPSSLQPQQQLHQSSSQQSPQYYQKHHQHQQQQQQSPLYISKKQQIPFLQKNRLYQKLKQITQQQLTQIVLIIQENSLETFKNLGNGRYQIYMDHFDQNMFRRINQKVNQFIENQKINNVNLHGNKKIKI